jgi:hypothetical protein
MRQVCYGVDGTGIIRWGATGQTWGVEVSSGEVRKGVIRQFGKGAYGIGKVGHGLAVMVA